MNINKKVFSHPAYFLAYGFGSGLSPKAPGTAGSLVGLLLWWMLSPMPLLNYLITIVVIIFLGIYVSDKVSSEQGEKDPSGIVIDEIAGILITLVLIPDGWYWVIAGFVSFRIFDILKPWPINWCDTHLKGGLGIMSDDIVAGLFSLAGIQIAFGLLALTVGI